MKEDLQFFVRREWFTLLRWISGISLFLLAALLSLLTYNASLTIPRTYDVSILKIVIPLLGYIIVTWGIQFFSVYFYYAGRVKREDLAIIFTWILEGANIGLYLFGFIHFGIFVFQYIK